MIINDSRIGKTASYSTANGERKTAIIVAVGLETILFNNYDWDYVFNVIILKEQPCATS